MHFDVKRKAMCGFDGRTLLRISLMKPDSEDTDQEKYIFRFVSTCEQYAEATLYPLLLSKLSLKSGGQNRAESFCYDVKVYEYTYKDYSSYVILSQLKKQGAVIAFGIKTLTFCDGKIIPPSYITRKHKYKKSALILDNEGKANLVSFVNGYLQHIPI